MALATRPKPSSYHRQRIGKHRSHNKNFLKSYWPYIPLLSILGIGLMINQLFVHSGQVLGAKSDFSTLSLLSATNQQRLRDQRSELSLNPLLSSAAQAKANDMSTNNYWAHTSPSGKTPWSFIIASGYHYQVAGENLAYGFNSAQASVAAWMASSEHRSNILNPSFQDVGFGIAQSPNFLGKGPEVIVVALYASPQNQLAVSRPSNITPKLQSITRLQLVSSSVTLWSVTATVMLTIDAVILFTIRQGQAWHKVIVKSEAFVLNHPWLDVLMLSIATLGIVMTRVAGVIG
ncbi:MAG TPA: CAP domain-containing protein [Candidatus Dormibacteraeota bacterium]|nr:CAP domain-containing protein [Candidatus Dormibacteraeota bacterium]